MFSLICTWELQFRGRELETLLAAYANFAESWYEDLLVIEFDFRIQRSSVQWPAAHGENRLEGET
jgi:hypothetical protein